MNRRGFLRKFGLAIATAVALPVVNISYDPVKQKVVKPKINNDCLNGYRGSQFLSTGYVYAPYIPLIITKDICG